MQNQLDKIKEDLLKYFSNLNFDEPTHTYTVGKTQLKSVSHFIGKYKNKFDSSSIAPLVAKKRGITTEEVLQEWEDTKNKSCELGTKVHLFGENYVNNGFKGEPSDGYEKAIVEFWKIIPNHIVPLVMELQMYNKDWEIAGTSDIILYNTLTKKIIIADYKTNKDLFKNYKEQKMLYPFNNYLDNSFNVYQLQLSMYQLLLEQTGLKVEKRIIVWIKPDGTFKCYKTEDLTKILLNELIK